MSLDILKLINEAKKQTEEAKKQTYWLEQIFDMQKSILEAYVITNGGNVKWFDNNAIPQPGEMWRFGDSKAGPCDTMVIGDAGRYPKTMFRERIK